MIKVLHIVGELNGWAIQKRAERLIKAMATDCAGVMVSFRQADVAAMNAADVVHVHGLQLVPLLRNRLPQCTRPWGFEVISDRAQKHLPESLPLIARASACWAKNPRLAAAIAPHVKCPVTYVPNGVDTNFFSPRPSVSASPRLPLRVGWVGNRRDANHLAYKGVPLIEQAVGLLGPGYAFTPFEGGYPDVRPQSELLEYYRSIDVLACASMAEGCSNVVLEALACGVPVVSTDVGIASELAADGLPVTIVERSAQAIVEGIVRSAKCEVRSFSAVGRYRWNSEPVAGRYLASYRRMCGVRSAECEAKEALPC